MKGSGVTLEAQRLIPLLVRFLCFKLVVESVTSQLPAPAPAAACAMPPHQDELLSAWPWKLKQVLPSESILVMVFYYSDRKGAETQGEDRLKIQASFQDRYQAILFH